MRFLHISDLHIGKTVNGFSMMEEQIFALRQISEYAVKKKVDVVLIAGDLYDRSVPPAQAVLLLDDFLTGLVGEKIKVCMIAGNHDSGERLEFGSRLLDKEGLYIEGELKKQVAFADIPDDFGTVRIHMVPYVRPAVVTEIYGKEGEDTDAGSYQHAMERVLDQVEYASDGRNILIAHQFAVNGSINPERSDSEVLPAIGGIDSVDVSLFKHFSYTALGHIHIPQSVGSPDVVYSGSPVKYSFSESRCRKSVVYGEIDRDGKVMTERLLLTPVHDMRIIRGPLRELTKSEIVKSGDCMDYILAVLTDDADMSDPLSELRGVYPNLMQMQFENSHVPSEDKIKLEAGRIKRLIPEELFADFYMQVMGKELKEEQKKLVADCVKDAKEAME